MTGCGIVEDGRTVTAGPFEQHGLGQLVIRSGDLVRQVNERLSDDYMPLGPETEVPSESE